MGSVLDRESLVDGARGLGLYSQRYERAARDLSRVKRRSYMCFRRLL